MTGIDNENSLVVGRLSDIIQEKTHKTFYMTSHRNSDPHTIQDGTHVLFVNAAIEGTTGEYSV